ncbi:MAG: hypothetical protein ACYC61_05035 [Isosphaeraceae bacterium]
MIRAICFLVAACLPSLAPGADDKATTPETLIRLVVQPAAAPTPALRHMLLPELNEMSPGNPIYHYMKCCMEHQGFLFDKQSFDRREQLLAMPLKELPVRDIQDYGRSVLMQADRAARMDKPDWQILEQLSIHGFSLLLPDIQQMRALARALQVRFRAEVAVGRFDDAVRTAKTMLALARHLGEHPTLIGDLVGIAIANMAIEPLEEMIGQPGCPNLYWALTCLPEPLISMKPGMAGECVIGLVELRDLDDRAPMSSKRIAKFAAHLDELLGQEASVTKAGGVRGWLSAKSKDTAYLTAARRRLVAIGMPEERLLRFPAEQVILLDEKREYEIRRDDFRKTLSLPTWQAEPMEEALRAARGPALLADAMLPGSRVVRRAQSRLEQRIALLRTIEAIRLHAAGHGGQFPARLAEISVPVPDDPFTGKPFRYERVGASGHLRGSPPRGAEKDSAFNIHYELTLRH